MSGTAKNGNLHYYYVCKNKKHCHKKNVQRDKIELRVAQAIKEYILKDDVIEWIADLVEDYQNTHKEKSNYNILQDQLKEIKGSIENVLSAIEKGIYTSSTKDRLLELEAQQRDIEAKAAAIKAECLEVPRDHVITWLHSFKDGRVEDKEYQAVLFNSFLSAVYLYDDHLKIVFSMSDTSSIDISILEDNSPNEAEKCSYKLCYGSPHTGLLNGFIKPFGRLHFLHKLHLFIVCSLF